MCVIKKEGTHTFRYYQEGYGNYWPSMCIKCVYPLGTE